MSFHSVVFIICVKTSHTVVPDDALDSMGLSCTLACSGDSGFDPLYLGTNPETLKWFAEAELTNGRWAMAAVAGILFTDLLGLPKFWLAGAEVCYFAPL